MWNMIDVLCTKSNRRSLPYGALNHLHYTLQGISILINLRAVLLQSSNFLKSNKWINCQNNVLKKVLCFTSFIIKREGVCIPKVSKPFIKDLHKRLLEGHELNKETSYEEEKENKEMGPPTITPRCHNHPPAAHGRGGGCRFQVVSWFILINTTELNGTIALDICHPRIGYTKRSTAKISHLLVYTD